jgi:hypothetical protein
MQRRDLTPEIRQVVDEASRLLTEGREMEARALFEKAEALVAQNDSANRVVANAGAAPRVTGNSGEALQGVIAPLAAKLAAGFTTVLTGVLEELHDYAGTQIDALAHSLTNQIQTMETELGHVAGVGEHLELLANDHLSNLQAVHQGQGELWDVVRGLQQSAQEHHESIARVSAATGELTIMVANHVEAVAARFSAVDERFSFIDRIIQDVPAQLSTVFSRLDRHTETLQVLEHRQAQRVSTLNQVLESLSRLKEPETHELAASARA